MRPRVIVYNGTSVDGRIDWGGPTAEQFYSRVGIWHEDATLAGSRTMYGPDATPDPEDLVLPPAQPEPGHERAILAVVDSRGAVRNWGQIRALPYWKDWVALCTRRTPPEHLAYLERVGVRPIVAGEERVDLAAALEMLAREYGVRVVRVDSGGILNGVLLRAGLVDEVSLLVHPALVGGESPRTVYRAPDLASSEGVIPLRLIHLETLPDGALWLRYEVVR